MKYYPPSDHIYYKDSGIPINKLNNGYEYIDYADTLNDDAFITASIDCMETDCSKMEEIILAGLLKS